MSGTVTTNVTAYALLGCAGAVALMLPDTLGIPGANAADPSSMPSEIRLIGAVRDFRKSHIDFDLTPSGGVGRYAGNVLHDVGPNGRPVFAGMGTTGVGTPINVLLVCRGTGGPTIQDMARRNALQSWGFNVQVIYDDEPQSSYDAAVAVNDVAYISEQACYMDVDEKLSGAAIGVVCESHELGDTEYGFGALTEGHDDDEIFVVDDGHYITAGYAGRVTIASLDIPMHRTDGSTAPGGTDLAQIEGIETIVSPDDGTDLEVGTDAASGHPALMIVEIGETLYGGAAAAGRRVRLPWGATQSEGTIVDDDDDLGGPVGTGACAFGVADDDDDDGGDIYAGSSTSMAFGSLNATGQQILKRSIEWAAAQESSTAATPAGYKIDSNWTDFGGDPIAPHLFATPSLSSIADLDVLLVCRSDGGLTEQDGLRQALLESWGCTVQLIYDDETQPAYNAALAANDVVYVSEQACYMEVGNKLLNAPIGVVCENRNLGDTEIGFAADTASLSDRGIEIRNTTHYITSGFSLGWLNVMDSDGPMHRTDGSTAAGCVELAELSGSGSPALMVVDTGDGLYGGGVALGRRVRLPWGQQQVSKTLAIGGDGSTTLYTTCAFATADDDDDVVSADDDDDIATTGTFDLKTLTSDGISLLKRSIEWAGHVTGTATVPTDDCGNNLVDSAGSAGVSSTGGIASVGSFAQWFVDEPGENLSTPFPIILTLSGGVYEFSSSTFFPIDGQLLGNQGQSHNFYFTYAIGTTFVHSACSDYFFEFEGNDDAWVFIDDRLAIDLGGTGTSARQRVDLDRLGLTDGGSYTLRFFFAQRQSATSRLTIRTNIPLGTTGTPLVSQMFD